MALAISERGQGLLPSTIDDLAKAESPRTYASIPHDDYDLSKGFRDVDYSAFANAINYAAHWLDRTLGSVAGDDDSYFPTFSYEGPKDLRFPILTVAAIKTHRKVGRFIFLALHLHSTGPRSTNGSFHKDARSLPVSLA